MDKLIKHIKTDPEIKQGKFSKAAREERRRVLEQIDIIVENKIIWRNK